MHNKITMEMSICQREQIENGKFSLNRCVLNKVASNSLFGKVGGRLWKNCLQGVRDKEFTETRGKKQENSLFFPFSKRSCKICRFRTPERRHHSSCYGVQIIAGKNSSRITDLKRWYRGTLRHWKFMFLVLYYINKCDLFIGRVGKICSVRKPLGERVEKWKRKKRQQLSLKR